MSCRGTLAQKLVIGSVCNIEICGADTTGQVVIHSDWPHTRSVITWRWYPIIAKVIAVPKARGYCVKASKNSFQYATRPRVSTPCFNMERPSVM